MNPNTSITAPATETSVGNIININSLARLAGLPYETRLMPSLARAYGVSPHTQLDQRLDLFDLVWATSAVLSGTLPARQVQVAHNSVRWFFEFLSYRTNPADPDSCEIMAELRSDCDPAQLHLVLPQEPDTTVLVVEDDSDLAELMRLLLEQHGLRTLTASTGRQGFQAAAQHRPDLILLDIDLPDISGWEVFQQLRARPATTSIPIVFCSGRADVECRALELGAQGWLRKPDDLAKLPQHLRRILGCA